MQLILIIYKKSGIFVFSFSKTCGYLSNIYVVVISKKKE